MAIITVFNFEVRDGQRGIYRMARAKCTKETIAAMGSYGRIIDGTDEEVDDSLLTGSKRYYRAWQRQGLGPVGASEAATR